jgi:hypothetical protein
LAVYLRGVAASVAESKSKQLFAACRPPHLSKHPAPDQSTPGIPAKFLETL